MHLENPEIQGQLEKLERLVLVGLWVIGELLVKWAPWVLPVRPERKAHLDLLGWTVRRAIVVRKAIWGSLGQLGRSDLREASALEGPEVQKVNVVSLDRVENLDLLDLLENAGRMVISVQEANKVALEIRDFLE